MRLIIVLLAAQSASPELAPYQASAPADPPPRLLLDLNLCPRSGPADEIVVCARRRGADPYRIPERLRNQAEPGQRLSGIGPASLDPDPTAACGIFQGQRRCNNREAALYGYGNGRDPITAAGRIIDSLSAPD